MTKTFTTTLFITVTAIFYHDNKIWNLPGIYTEFLSCLTVCKESEIQSATRLYNIMISTLTKLTDWTHLAHSTLRIRWSYPNPDTPAMALAASSRRWKLIKANPCWNQDENTEPCSVSVQCQQFKKKEKKTHPNSAADT